MYPASLLLASFFAHAATAKPPMSYNYTATYEYDQNGAILSAPLPKYDGLYYKNIVIGPYDYQSSFCAYVCPQSFPVLVVSGNGYTETPGSISTIYKDSNVTKFDLHSLYWGCAAHINRTDPSDPSHIYTNYEPANCTLTVLGYRSPKGNRLPAAAGIAPDLRATFKYRPTITPNAHTGASSAPMALASFTSVWSDLKVVTFEVANRRPPYLDEPLFYMDDLSYSTYNITRQAET